MDSVSTYSIHSNNCAVPSAAQNLPEIAHSAFVHPLADVVGHAHIGKRVMVAPTASIRGDNGQPICLGNDVNVQDGVVIHALETHTCRQPLEPIFWGGDGECLGVCIGDRVSLAQQCQIHGPALVGDDTFIGLRALIFRAIVGRKCVIEPRALVMGVTIDDGRYIPAGALITTQEAAKDLPLITEQYPLRGFNQAVVHVNVELAAGYQNPSLQRNKEDPLLKHPFYCFC